MNTLLTARPHKHNQHEYILAAVGLAVAALLFFWEPLFTWPADSVLAGGDIAAMFAPWQTFIFDSLRQYGELPLWNPYLFGGTPFAANPQPLMFYPFTYLGMLMPLVRAMALTLAIHAWLGGMGMYGWLRSLGATHAGAFLAGAAFAFTGEFALRIGVGHYGIALQLAWWPLSFWALQAAFNRASWRRAILGGAPPAMGLLSGHIATCLLLYVALSAYTLSEAIAAYAAGRQWRAGARTLGLAGAALATSFALAAVQYLPLYNFSQLSVRAASPSLDFSSRFSMPIGHLVTLLVPNFFGEVIRTGYWSVEGYEEFTYYAGVLVVLMAVVGVRLARQQRRLLSFLVIAAGALLLQLGPDGVLFVLFYRFVPGFALTRAPGRAGLIYLFAIVTAAGLAWSELERAPHDVSQRLLSVFNKTFVWVISTLVMGAILLSFILYAALKPAETAWTWHLGGQLTQFLVLFWAALGLFAIWRHRGLSQRAINVLAVAIVLFDLWSYGLKNIRPGSNPLVPAWQIVADFIQGRASHRVAAEELDIFQLNGALASRTRSHYGYDPLVLTHYQTLLNSAPNYFDRVYDLLNVKYVITRNRIDFEKPGPRFKIIVDTDQLKIYRRPGPLPRAFIVHDAKIEPDDKQALAFLHAEGVEISRTVTLPASPPCSLETATSAAEETADVVGESPNHLELTTQSNGAGLLVLSEVDYAGWRASVDGQPTPVLRVDTALRAVCLPAGAHSVRFDFQPPDVTIGAIISCLALSVVIGAGATGFFSSRRKNAPLPLGD